MNLIKHASKVDTKATRGSAQHSESMTRFAQAARRTISSLDTESYGVLAQTVELLHKVSVLSNSTKMSTHALGIVFAPVFFLEYIPLEKVQTLLSTVIWITETMLEKFQDLIVDQENINRYHRLDLPHFKRSEFAMDSQAVAVAAKAEEKKLVTINEEEEQQPPPQQSRQENDVEPSGVDSSSSRLLRTRSNPAKASRMSVRNVRASTGRIARISDKSTKRSSWFRDLDLYRSKNCQDLVQHSRNSTAF
jgi:hypothetical protein